MTIQEEISNCVLKHFEKAYINNNNERSRILEIRQPSKIKNFELYFTVSLMNEPNTITLKQLRLRTQSDIFIEQFFNRYIDEQLLDDIAILNDMVYTYKEIYERFAIDLRHIAEKYNMSFTKL